MNAESAEPRSRSLRIAFLLLLALLFAAFCALGTWQVQRLQWKRALIERVDSRVQAAPVAAPPRAQWPQVGVERDEYQRVFVQGRYLPGDTRVDALTELGPGHWILSPLRTGDGATVLVNRGFVPAGSAPAAAPEGPVRVEGLLRLDEPGGRVLRENVPAQDRWYSRDLAAIAAARDLGEVAPYFIDAGFDPGAPEWPRGGMTVVRFRDHHLQYALTWFALALMVAYAAYRVIFVEQRRPRPLPPRGPTDVQSAADRTRRPGD